MAQTPSIAFVTLGCPKNEVDSDRMAAAVASSAYRLADSPEDADVVVLNTCAFIQEATEASIAEALALASDWRPAGTSRRLVVAGCMVSRYGAELEEAMPEADAFVPVADEGSLLRVIERLTGVPADARPSPGRTAPGPTAYLKVTEGCDRRCAYCTIPAIRGPFVSTPPQEVEAEARTLLSLGARELVLVGQDIASYGRDLNPPLDLAWLVEKLSTLEGDFRIRLMYVQPDGITDRLLATMAARDRVCPYLDVPFQHASASVLRAMRRAGDARTFLALIDRIRDAVPGVVLRTTVMAGFPGETAHDLAELESFIEAAAFDYVGVFAYSPEEGTEAAAMPRQLRPSVRRARAQRLRDRADEIGTARVAERVGTLCRVLVEGTDEEGRLWGRTCGQAPDVDGITLLEGEAAIGSFVTVRVTDAFGYDLVGEPV